MEAQCTLRWCAVIVFELVCPILLKLILFIYYFWLCWVFVAVQGFCFCFLPSGCREQGLLSLSEVHRLLLAVASLAAEHRP